jgi:hypothetical protein
MDASSATRISDRREIHNLLLAMMFLRTTALWLYLTCSNPTLSLRKVSETLEKKVRHGGCAGEAAFCAAVIATAHEFEVDASQIESLHFEIDRFRERGPELFQC